MVLFRRVIMRADVKSQTEEAKRLEAHTESKDPFDSSATHAPDSDKFKRYPRIGIPQVSSLPQYYFAIG